MCPVGSYCFVRAATLMRYMGRLYTALVVWYDMIYLLTAVGLTPGGSSTVQYTFTHKQYTEQHNETEYTERNVHSNKNA